MHSNYVSIVRQSAELVAEAGVILPLILMAGKELLALNQYWAHLLKVLVYDVETREAPVMMKDGGGFCGRQSKSARENAVHIFKKKCVLRWRRKLSHI